MKRRPEAIARPCEMMSDHRRVHAWIDATKQHSQIRSNEIWYDLTNGSSEFFLGWLHNSFADSSSAFVGLRGFSIDTIAPSMMLDA
jgi:hypothetical protein